MKKLATYALCLFIVFLPACEGLGMTQQQRSAARIALDNELAMGRITQAQHDAAVDVLEKPSYTADDWANLLYAGGTVLVSLLTGVPIAVGIVQKKRGAPRTPEQTAALQTLAAKE